MGRKNIPSLFRREAGNSTFFIEKPELPFLASPLYVGGKIESRAIPQHTSEEQNLDLGKLTTNRVRYVNADTINCLFDI
jgi:hypothetical protein